MFTTLETYDTKFSADSVEWCPINGFDDLFVCGTYQLTDDELELQKENKLQKRLGIIYLFRVIPPGQLKLLQQINVPAVLDMKWAHVKYQQNILLGVVNSIGYLQIYKLVTNDEIKIELIVEKKLREVEGEILALSLDWSSGKCPAGDDDIKDVKIIVSDSQGWISLFHLNNADLKIVESEKVHDYEAWIAAFNYWDPNIIYSGGDDCKFQMLDARMGLKSAGCNRVHGAGVTSLHSNSTEEYCLASGSYDEILRLWDTRNFRRPISETNIGGGIWRLKWDPFHGKYLFAACMYGGFRIVDCEKKVCPEVIEEYNEHKSIAYGCDWSFLSREKIFTSKLCPATCQKIILAATCSFYDHTLKLSSINFSN